MITARIKGDDVIKALKNSITYTDEFVKTLKDNKDLLNRKVGEESISAFYDYLDGLARSHPGMLHHVYEWGHVGDPMARLYELTLNANGTSAVVSAKFLQSDLPADGSNEPFYDKARIMEEGIPVTINQVDAKALFFEVDGEEFFRMGPIFIANPGGPKVRGAFVNAFNEFYGHYFTQVHLEAIRFYKYFSDPVAYSRYFSSAVKSNPSGKGRTAALSWIMNAPGGE